jgi:choline dehydrogenase-like flavoprotein
VYSFRGTTSSFSSMGLRDIPAVLVSGTRAEIEESERQRASVVEGLVQDMKRHGVTTDYRTLLFSAHQMGTCKMGSGRTTSVVDAHGETWGCSNLFVCDASVFPTSSGVNPM